MCIKRKMEHTQERFLVEMLKSIGVSRTLIGHSERRAYFNESDEVLLEKIEFALSNGLSIIFCFGEELSDRKSNKHFKVVKVPTR